MSIHPITNAYNYFEQTLINTVVNKLTEEHREKLNQLVGIYHQNKKHLQRPLMTLIKQINQSLRPADIQDIGLVKCNTKSSLTIATSP